MSQPHCSSLTCQIRRSLCISGTGLGQPAGPAGRKLGCEGTDPSPVAITGSGTLLFHQKNLLILKIAQPRLVLPGMSGIGKMEIHFSVPSEIGTVKPKQCLSSWTSPAPRLCGICQRCVSVSGHWHGCVTVSLTWLKSSGDGAKFLVASSFPPSYPGQPSRCCKCSRSKRADLKGSLEQIKAQTCKNLCTCSVLRA